MADGQLSDKVLWIYSLFVADQKSNVQNLLREQGNHITRFVVREEERERERESA